MVIVNGCPKSGTHAVMAWLSRMGLKRCPGVLASHDGGLDVFGSRLDLATLSAVPDSVFMQGHVVADEKLDGFSVVTVFRDPRNVLASYVRHRKRWGGIELTVTEALSNFWGQPFPDVYRRYLGWHGRGVVLRYENLAADHIGDGSEVYDQTRPEWDQWIGNTRTGAPSNWREVWNAETDAAWIAAGGQQLLADAGY